MKTMKIKEFLTDLAKNSPGLFQTHYSESLSPSTGLEPDPYDGRLYPASLSDELKQRICQLDEFKSIKNIKLLNHPNFLLKENGELEDSGVPIFSFKQDVENMPTMEATYPIGPTNTLTYKLYDDTKLLGNTLYLYSLGFSPKIYELHKTDKEGISQSPVVLEETLWKPLKTISITYSPEALQDLVANPELTGLKIESILKEVKKLLLSGEATVPFTRDVFMRGIIL